MYIHQSSLKRLLGVPVEYRDHMPPDYCLAPQKVDGVYIYIAPTNKGEHGKSQFGHRVKAICPHCDKHLSAGRYFQHVKVHGIKVQYRYVGERI